MEEIKKPSQSFSLKRLSLISADVIAKSFKDVGPGNDFALSLITPAGMIVGDIKKPNVSQDRKDYFHLDEETKKLNYDLQVVFQQLDEAIKQLHEDNVETRQDAASFTMENVMFFPESNLSKRINFEQMIVFVEQVISATIVSRNFAD